MKEKFLTLINHYNNKKAKITRVRKSMYGQSRSCGKTMIQLRVKPDLYLVVYRDGTQWIYNDYLLKCNFAGGQKCQTLPK